MILSTIFKRIVFIWGIISLCFVVIIGLLLGIMLLKQKRHTTVDYQLSRFEKTFGDYKLQVEENDTTTPRILHVTLTQAEKRLLNHYRLPIEKYGLNYGVKIDSAIVDKGIPGQYRVILVSEYSECACESNNQYLWFLSLKDTTVTVVKVLELSDFRSAQSAVNIFWGNKHITIDESPRAHFIIPLKITVDNAVRIAPLLDRDGIRLSKESFAMELTSTLDDMKKAGDTTVFKRVQQTQASFQEAITSRVIEF